MFTSLSKFRIEPLGDYAAIVKTDGHAADLAAYLESASMPGVVDIVPAFDDVAVYFDGATLDEQLLTSLMDKFEPSQVKSGRHHFIPVCYGMGEDLEGVCTTLGLSATEFIAAHSSRKYDCKAVGFCPGFAYLGWLDERIATLGRKETPRLRVPAGSVAIAGRMTAVYPLEKPGGWWLIGQTPLTLVSPDEGFFPISVGDTVEIRPIEMPEFDRLKGERL